MGHGIGNIQFMKVEAVILWLTNLKLQAVVLFYNLLNI